MHPGSRLLLVLLGASLILALGLPSAIAATGTATSAVTPLASVGGTITPAPTVTGALQVQLLLDGEPGKVLAIMNVALPKNTRLPAMVRVPLPKGAEVVWAGEVLGGDPSADPVRPYRIVSGEGGDVLEMTLEKSGAVQIEASVGLIDREGDLATAELPWVQSATAQSTQFSVRFPPASSKHQTTPRYTGSPERNDAGETLYVLPRVKLALGDEYAVKATYVLNPELPQPRPATDSSVILYVLIGALVAAVAILFLAISRRGGSPGA